jgi:hypothetical protein
MVLNAPTGWKVGRAATPLDIKAYWVDPGPVEVRKPFELFSTVAYAVPVAMLLLGMVFEVKFAPLPVNWAALISPPKLE